METNDPAVGARRIEVIECRDCITAWQGPTVFTEFETKAFYAAQYSKKEQGTYFDKSRRREVSNLQLDFIESVTGRIGSLLDVGAGDGAFVETAISHGWKGHGVDLSHESEHVTQGTIDSVDGTFDVITMWDVIEHVEDPVDTIAQAAHRLREGGKLILETGNYLGIDRIMSDTAWWGFHVDHRWFHSPLVIEKLLRDAGFTQFNYAPRMLRPLAQPMAPYLGPSALRALLRCARRPQRTKTIFRQFRELRASAERCPALAPISIFTVASGK